LQFKEIKIAAVNFRHIAIIFPKQEQNIAYDYIFSNQYLMKI